MIFRCKACEEKDKRYLESMGHLIDHMADLKKEIEFLKNMLQPATLIPRINIEANNVLNGAGEDEPTPTQEEIEQLQREEHERNALLSGNYS